MDIRSITRTAAVIYADNMSSRTTNTIKRKFVESAYINNNNSLLTLAELINKIEEEMGLLFSEEEIKKIVKDKDFFVEVLNRSSEDIKYNLQEKRYSVLCSKPIDEMSEVIENYFSSHQDYIVKLTIESFKDLIYRYLHSILDSNISAYSHFVGSISIDKIPKMNQELFNDEEIDIINDFVKWDNDAKNRAIFKLVNYCIEYAVVVNNSSEDVLSKSLRTKIFYLDNTILYRALGINGETRRRRTISFLKKCKESGQKFVISKFTRIEFFNTIEYHLQQLNTSTPFGQISPRTFRRYANGDGFYQFYHEWRDGRINYGFDIFKTHIHTLYKKLVKQFDIGEDFKVPFNEREEPSVIAIYRDEIQTVKKTNRNEPHLMDARNMFWIECIRNGNNIDIASTKYYFITSDQKLQFWDKNHSTNQPLTLLPSQWMGLILKYVSRSSDDYKSFISFMNLPKDNSVISEDELQAVMAGISEMTEEFSKQESIIESMVEIKFGDILKGNIQGNAKAYAKDKLEKELEKQLEKKERERLEQTKAHDNIVSQIKEEAKKLVEDSERRLREEKHRNIVKDIDSLERRQNGIMEQVDDRRTLLKVLLFGGEVVLITGWIIMILKIGWDTMEMWTYLIGLPLFLFPNLFFAIKGRSINLISYIERICHNYQMQLYAKYDFSDNELDELKKMKEQIERTH